MSTPFRVRKLDSPALEGFDSESLPEMRDIELVLTKAFTGDLFTAIVTGHDPKDPATTHIGPFWKSTVVAGLLGGEVYVAETDDTERRIVGCAVWFGPRHIMYDTEAQQKYSLGPLMASFSEELQQWWHAQFLPRYDNFVASALGDGAKHNSWHLQTLGVDPQYQRKGAAGLLIDVIVEKARRTGAMLCVETETETNVEVYTKLGFQVMPKGKNGIYDCSNTFIGVNGDSFPMWVLVRETN